MKEAIFEECSKDENMTKFNQVLKETVGDEVFIQDLTLTLFIEMVRLKKTREVKKLLNDRTEAHQGSHKYAMVRMIYNLIGKFIEITQIPIG
ncbi:hypothetical protein WN48_05435 [Eufriesea mexicana]|nr:hypothetical protein WN48_05435 [Eufriesea mexicana]